jgi:hypothetical protein
MIIVLLLAAVVDSGYFFYSGNFFSASNQRLVPFVEDTKTIDGKVGCTNIAASN